MKNLFAFRKDTINYIYEKLEPYCRKKKLNLVSIPEFVYKILENPDYRHKPDAARERAKKAKEKKNALKKSMKKLTHVPGSGDGTSTQLSETDEDDGPVF